MRITHLQALGMLRGLFVVLHALGNVLLCTEDNFVVSNSLLLP